MKSVLMLRVSKCRGDDSGLVMVREPPALSRPLCVDWQHGPASLMLRRRDVSSHVHALGPQDLTACNLIILRCVGQVHAFSALGAASGLPKEWVPWSERACPCTHRCFGAPDAAAGRATACRPPGSRRQGPADRQACRQADRASRQDGRHKIDIQLVQNRKEGKLKLKPQPGFVMIKETIVQSSSRFVTMRKNIALVKKLSCIRSTYAVCSQCGLGCMHTLCNKVLDFCESCCDAHLLLEAQISPILVLASGCLAVGKRE
jgi:hypothetical protein